MCFEPQKNTKYILQLIQYKPVCFLQYLLFYCTKMMEGLFTMVLLFHTACVNGFLDDSLPVLDLDDPSLFYLNTRPLNQLSLKNNGDPPAKRGETTYSRNFLRFGRNDVFREPEEYEMYEDYDYARPTRSGWCVINTF